MLQEILLKIIEIHYQKHKAVLKLKIKTVGETIRKPLETPRKPDGHVISTT